METLEELHDKLFELSQKRYTLINNNVKKSDPGYKKLTAQQDLVEKNISKIKSNRKKNKLERKTITKEEVSPLPDEYIGIRCEYCGGETIDSICVNKSDDWPHG